jgi:hypothetical protein
MDNDTEQYALLEWDYDMEKRKIFIDNLAPIVLFTYNRLDHTKQTVEALKKNVYAEESKLFIYSDAPKNEAVKEKVDHVRAYLHTIKGFKSITIVEREENWGLARNIIDGVTKIVNEYGKIIVLEDDIITSKYFLKYMNDGLEVYKNKARVMEIVGYIYPIKNNGLPETFFLRVGDCWGWATWARAWKNFERNPQKLIEGFSQKEIYEFDFENKANLWQQVIDNRDGKIYTWAIFWAAIIFKKGLTMYPSRSLVYNVGLDSTGEHCGVTNDFSVDISNEEVKRFTKRIVENEEGYLAFKRYFKRMRGTFVQRVVNKISRVLKKMRANYLYGG